MPCGMAASAWRWCVAHSPTTRRLLRKPSASSSRQSSAPLRHPSCQYCPSCGNQGVRLLWRSLKTSSRSPRRTRRTRPRLRPVTRTIRLIGTPSAPIRWIQHVGFLAPLKAFELQTFRRRQNTGIQLRVADSSSYGRDCATDGGQTRIACVLQKVPTVGNLGRIRKRFGNRLSVSAVRE